MANRAEYDASQLDWDRLKRYAQRVARETGMPRTSPVANVIGEHWPLDRRRWTIQKNSRSGGQRYQETIHETHLLALLPDGRLVKVITAETASSYSGTAGRGSDSKFWHNCRDAEESDITALDFERRYTEQGRSNDSQRSWGDRDPGRRLVRHAKGVGVNLALKDVLEGRPPRA